MFRKVLSRRPAYYLASAAFAILSCLYLAGMIHHPYVGVELAQVNGQWIVTASDPNGAAYKAGVRVGDRIVQINHHDPGAYGDVLTWNEAESAKTLKLHLVLRHVQPLFTG